MKKFLISTLASVIMFASMVSATSAATVSFGDIADSYAKDAIIDLQAKGIINGMDDTHFDPKGTLTRAQFVTIIVKALGLEAKATTTAFTDVTDWAIPYVEAAAKASVVEGVSNNNFAPDEHITREAAVTILVRSLKTKGKLDEATAVNFTDADKISVWAKPFIASALQYGLISGYPDGTFDPTGIANREMAAIMGKNLLTAIAKVASVTQAPTIQEPTVTTPTTPTTPIYGGGGGGSRRSSNGGVTPPTVPTQEVPTITDGKATFANGTTVEGLPAGATISAKVATVTAMQGIEAAGQAMDFTFTGTMPAEGLTLSLPTTSNDAGLSYFNDKRNKWELQDGSEVVPVGSNKFVQAKVHHFSTYGPIVKSAQLIADGIAAIVTPKKDATNLALPTVIGGYTIAIKSSDKPNVIALDGTITYPSVETTVALVLEVTKTSDGSKAVTESLDVVVPAKPALSNIATVTSSVYKVSSGVTENETITEVTYGTSKAAFLAGLVKVDANQEWNVSELSDPVVTGDKLIVTAQDGTKVTYTVNGLPPKPDTKAPSAPVLSATLEGRQAILTWIANQEVDLAGYNVYQDATKLNSALLTVTGTTYTVTGLTYGTNYSFQVSAVDIAGNESAKSLSVSYTPAAPVENPETLLSNPTLTVYAPNADMEWTYLGQPYAPNTSFQVNVNFNTGTTTLAFKAAEVSIYNGNTLLATHKAKPDLLNYRYDGLSDVFIMHEPENRTNDDSWEIGAYDSNQKPTKVKFTLTDNNDMLHITEGAISDLVLPVASESENKLSSPSLTVFALNLDQNWDYNNHTYLPNTAFQVNVNFASGTTGDDFKSAAVSIYDGTTLLATDVVKQSLLIPANIGLSDVFGMGDAATNTLDDSWFIGGYPSNAKPTKVVFKLVDNSGTVHIAEAPMTP
jgi:uncharacterized cupredoxin-like copper-binding protein